MKRYRKEMNWFQIFTLYALSGFWIPYVITLSIFANHYRKRCCK